MKIRAECSAPNLARTDGSSKLDDGRKPRDASSGIGRLQKYAARGPIDLPALRYDGQAEAAEKENQIKTKKMTAIPSSHGQASACWTCDKVIVGFFFFRAASRPLSCNSDAIVAASNDRCSRVDTTHQTEPQTIASAGSCFD